MRNFNRFFLSLSLVIGLFLSACNETDPVLTALDADVIVVNEGNFNSADATLSAYNSSTGQVFLSVFASTNGFPFAGTLQNVVEYQDKYFAVISNTDKLEVLNKSDFKSVATIKPGSSAPIKFASPFSFAAVGNKGYISNWGTYNPSTWGYDNPSIVVVDLTNYTITGKIDVTERPQHLLAIGNKIYVSDVTSNTISIINTSTDQIEANKIAVGKNGPDKMLLDANNKLWVICRSKNLVRINPATNEVEATIENIESLGFNAKLVTNGEKNKLYYMASKYAPDYSYTDAKIFEIAITATSAPANPIITGRNFYGLGVHPKTGVIYVADANAFQSNGTIIRYKNDGTEMDSFAAGKGPNGFIFR